jgi:DNA-binding NtrC family response regulator
MTVRLIILDPEADRECAGNCARIRVLAQEAVFSDVVDVSEVHHIAESPAGCEPDLVVLRAPTRRPLHELLQTLKEKWRGVPVMVAVCNISRMATELLHSFRHGLDDFLCCPFSDTDFAIRLRRWLPDRSFKETVRLASIDHLKLDMVVGESPAFLKAICRIPQVARSSATVLIGGETGVGKELFARAIHYNGERKSRPFIPINCSAVPENLFENELFGHARGAYTDAGNSEKGLLAEAEGGTIFLDEVDMLAPSSQAKLLRFLQNREYRPLGSAKTVHCDVRVAAATNDNLRDLVSERRFRDDLFHRLNVLYLHVPPLRERASDIPILANHFLARFAVQYKRAPMRLSAGAFRKMMLYSWPGNVREMEAIIHRAVVFSTSALLQSSDIDLPQDMCAVANGTSKDRSKDEIMEEFERSYLVALLSEHHGNVSQAAHAAHKDRRTFQRLLRKHSIERVFFVK